MINNLTSPIPPTFMSTELIEPSPLDPLCIRFLHPNDADRIIKKYPDFEQATVVTEFIPEGTLIMIPKDEAIRWFFNLCCGEYTYDEDIEKQIIESLLKRIEEKSKEQ